MAYLFMTELFPEDPEGYVDGTWEPDGGENAVILQPGDPPLVETIPRRTGPTLFRMVPGPDKRGRVPEPCEYVVALERGEGPDSLSHEEAAASLADETAVAEVVRHPPTPRGEWVPHGDLSDWRTIWFTWERLPPAPKVFRGLLSRRWVVERTCSWLGQGRRLSKEYERSCEASEAVIYATMSPPRRLSRWPLANLPRPASSGWPSASFGT